MRQTGSANARAARFRDRQRAKGLRPITIWVPDIRDPGYARRVAAACAMLAALSDPDADADAAAGLADAFRHMPGWP